MIWIIAITTLATSCLICFIGSRAREKGGALSHLVIAFVVTLVVVGGLSALFNNVLI